MVMPSRSALLLGLAAAGAAAQSGGSCVDAQPECVGWARMGECLATPGFMLHACCKSCSSTAAAAPPPAEAWELEDLETPYPDSAIVDVRGDTLAQLAAERGDAPILVWFYAVSTAGF